MAKGVRVPHDFCWINILTPEPAEAQEFYSAVLGWTYADMPGMGHLIMVGEDKIGGMFDTNSPQTPTGTHPQIGVMVKVTDADAAAAKVESLGGRVSTKMDIGTNGRMAVCTDPYGAGFDLWQPINQPGMTVEAQDHGAPSWFEVMEKDVEGAKKFYTSLFGWTTSAMQMPGFEYITWQLDGRGVGGMFPLTDDKANMPPVWATYFTVKDIAKAVEQIEELGGSVHIPISDIPTVGQMAFVQSPQGVTFYLIQYSQRA